MTIVTAVKTPDPDVDPKAKIGFVGDIEHETKTNSDFRRVLYTGKNVQLVLMAIAPGDDIGEETHEGHDQFFRIEKGKGEVWINGHRSAIKSDDAIIVPAGARHNVVNTGDKPLKLYTLTRHPSIATPSRRRPGRRRQRPRNISTVRRRNEQRRVKA